MTARDLIATVAAAGAVLRPRIWCEGVDRLPPALQAELKVHEAEVLRTLVMNDAISDRFPNAGCAICGGGYYWRVSILSGGPGPWCCSSCDPAPADVWQDGVVVPREAV